jgi:hypothetical protein
MLGHLGDVWVMSAARIAYALELENKGRGVRLGHLGYGF